MRSVTILIQQCTKTFDIRGHGNGSDSWGFSLSVAFPLLMYWNNERFDEGIVILFLAMALLGVWCYLYFKRYTMTLSDEGFVVHRLWRPPFTTAWRDIVKIKNPLEAHEVEFEMTDRRKIKISVYFPGLEPLLTAARKKLSEVVWSRD
jgi:hypothetical protein